MGESAGASSILHHITSAGGDEYEKPPFSRAILMSPAFFPQPDNEAAGMAFAQFQFEALSPSLAHLRSKDTAELIFANARTNHYAPYGTFRYGPTVEYDDNYSYVPKLPGQLLAEGKYHKNISLLLGHAYADGLLFTPPWIRNNTALEEHTKLLYPTTPKNALEKIRKLYPMLSLGPKALVGLVSDFLDDVSVSCNNVYLQEPLLKSGDAPVYRYLFGPPPAPMHGLIPFYVVSALDLGHFLDFCFLIFVFLFTRR
jgi:carboxylesterase type B